MAREVPRVNANLPVSILIDGIPEVKTATKNLGLRGVFIEESPSLDDNGFKKGEIIKFKIDLPKLGMLYIKGKILRLDGGVAVRFSDLTEENQIKLWRFLQERLESSEQCPYCGKSCSSKEKVCGNCGWNLNFSSKNYLNNLKREFLVRSLLDAIPLMSYDQLQKFTDMVDVDKIKDIPTEAEQGIIEEILLGKCNPMRKVISEIKKVARTDLSVLIFGETGTGKELTAQAIHNHSLRKDNSFIPINCAAIPETLLETELFGYEKGTYTGAYTSKSGKIESAHDGTLFLDEVGELSPVLQSKFLRFLDDGIVERVGSRNRKKINTRIIAATNRDLEHALNVGLLRSDFYHRLSVFEIKLPPLRERGEDKLMLANHFLKKFSRELAIYIQGFSKDAIECIDTYAWPGNVREIINKICRAILVSQGEIVSARDLELRDSKSNYGKSLISNRLGLDCNIVEDSLINNNYNISKTAQTLNISRPHLYKLIKMFNIEIVRKR